VPVDRRGVRSPVTGTVLLAMPDPHFGNPPPWAPFWYSIKHNKIVNILHYTSQFLCNNYIYELEQTKIVQCLDIRDSKRLRVDILSHALADKLTDSGLIGQCTTRLSAFGTREAKVLTSAAKFLFSTNRAYDVMDEHQLNTEYVYPHFQGIP
jgi:hypothetical protein